MSTPYEYGAGFQDGDAFVQDGDGEIMFRFNRLNTQQVIPAVGASVIWTTGQGTSVPARYMDPTHTTFTPSAPGWYRFSGAITVGNVGGATRVIVGLVSLTVGAPAYPLVDSLVVAPLVGASYSFSVAVPITPVSGVLPGYSLRVVPIGSGGTFALEPSTASNLETFLDIEELSMPVTAVVQTL